MKNQRTFTPYKTYSTKEKLSYYEETCSFLLTALYEAKKISLDTCVTRMNNIQQIVEVWSDLSILKSKYEQLKNECYSYGIDYKKVINHYRTIGF